MNKQHSLTHPVFLKRLFNNFMIGAIIIAISLFIGILGYHYFENMSWMDAFVNASMILSGMGPLTHLNTDAGKLFAGLYALFSGIIFLVVIGIIFAPLVHWFFVKFHMEEEKRK